jgi:hypothetical protein
LLATALWVTSYFRPGRLSGFQHSNARFRVTSVAGAIVVFAGMADDHDPWNVAWFEFESPPQDMWKSGQVIAYQRKLKGFALRLEYWLPAGLLFACTIAPWLRWRFSLRTLLITVTAAAVGLWFIVWMVRR